MKDMGTLIIRLFLITAVAGLVLSLVNNATAPVIAEQQAKKLAESLIVAYPEAESFEPLSAEETAAAIGDNPNVKEIYKALVGGQEAGYVFSSIGKQGFGGDISFIVGISKEGAITGWQVLNHSETPGYGQQIEQPFFAEGITGNQIAEDLVAVETPSADNDIQAISGSTITTKSVLGGLNGTLAIARELIK
ncbi:MAG: RnfABCDGE type electron transport complex subunit G [Tissierellia bacterium]|nr:RnfABCDGE type electron transport complex subunit G [Tissierellia bacterium]